MSLGLTVPGPKKGLDQIPCNRRTDSPASHTKDIHVIIFDPLHGREVIVNQRGADAVNLVGTHRRTDAAAADRHAAIDLSRDDGLGERRYIVRIVVALTQIMGTEIDNFMPRATKPADEFLLQTKSTVICRNSHTHSYSNF